MSHSSARHEKYRVQARALRMPHDRSVSRDRAQWPPRSIEEIRVERDRRAAVAQRVKTERAVRADVVLGHAPRLRPEAAIAERIVSGVLRDLRPTQIANNSSDARAAGESRGFVAIEAPSGLNRVERGRSFRFRLAEFLRTAISMSRRISRLLDTGADLVRLLPVSPSGMAANSTRHTHTTAKDFRIICDCQRHAMRERTLWRRSLRAASQFKRSGVALLVGVPLAFGVAEFPSMNSAASETHAVVNSAIALNGFPVFTTSRTRQGFLAPQSAQPMLTFEVTKEAFFRTHVPYGSIIYREAKRNKLAPELVAAVIEAESDFRPRLISEKNAQGLMQIVPSTGELLGAENLFDPEQNIAAGTKYLKYLIDRFGDLRMALAAYNAGEGNIEKFGGVPPFPETLNYVQRVNSHTRWYRLRVRDTFLSASRLSVDYAR